MMDNWLLTREKDNRASILHLSFLAASPKTGGSGASSMSAETQNKICCADGDECPNLCYLLWLSVACGFYITEIVTFNVKMGENVTINMDQHKCSYTDTYLNSSLFQVSVNALAFLIMVIYLCCKGLPLIHRTKEEPHPLFLMVNWHTNFIMSLAAWGCLLACGFSLCIQTRFCTPMLLQLLINFFGYLFLILLYNHPKIFHNSNFYVVLGLCHVCFQTSIFIQNTYHEAHMTDFNTLYLASIFENILLFEILHTLVHLWREFHHEEETPLLQGTHHGAQHQKKESKNKDPILQTQSLEQVQDIQSEPAKITVPSHSDERVQDIHPELVKMTLLVDSDESVKRTTLDSG